MFFLRSPVCLMPGIQQALNSCLLCKLQHLWGIQVIQVHWTLKLKKTLRLWCFVSFQERQRLTLDLLRLPGVGSNLSWPPGFSPRICYGHRLSQLWLPTCFYFPFLPPFGSSMISRLSKGGRRIRRNRQSQSVGFISNRKQYFVGFICLCRWWCFVIVGAIGFNSVNRMRLKQRPMGVC